MSDVTDDRVPPAPSDCRPNHSAEGTLDEPTGIESPEDRSGTRAVAAASIGISSNQEGDIR